MSSCTAIGDSIGPSARRRIIGVSPLSFRCGSGGWLIDSGAYEGDNALLTLTERGPRTFGLDSMWVYCAHCSVNNEMQSVESTGRLTSVEFRPRPATPPGRCPRIWAVAVRALTSG